MSKSANLRRRLKRAQRHPDFTDVFDKAKLEIYRLAARIANHEESIRVKERIREAKANQTPEEKAAKARERVRKREELRVARKQRRAERRKANAVRRQRKAARREANRRNQKAKAVAQPGRGQTTLGRTPETKATHTRIQLRVQ